jgi:ketosteroid isomerase-like protein
MAAWIPFIPSPRGYLAMAKSNMVPADFAPEWIAAWNSRDLERVLSHYTDDFEMSSPLIVSLMEEPSGTLRGKAAIRDYWQLALSRNPTLHFTLQTAYAGANSLMLAYRNQNHRDCAEVLFFNAEGRIYRAAAHYS